MTEESPIRVMVVDDHAVIRDGITALLSDCADISVVATADSATEALQRYSEHAIDVVLMDLFMPEMDGATATARLLERDPHALVVVLTGFVEPRSIQAAVQAGASACLLKTVGKDDLAEAIRGVTRGRSMFSSEFLPHLLSQPQDVTPARGLTPRESDILTLVADGQTNKGIAETLGLSDGTVRVYVSTILAKLGAANRTEATVMAIREGLVGEQS